MVLATGRRVLGNAHDAKDVFQAAFLLLAQKATSQRWQPSVASWLYQTVHLLALKTRQSATRRARRERRAVARSPANPLAELTGQERLAVLDEELLALPEPLRAPLVLCYLEGAPRDEAAERLGYPLSTLKKRLERGRDRLHAALARRGFGLSAALLGTLVAGGSAAAVPGELAQRTSHAAVAARAGPRRARGFPPGSPNSLTEGSARRAGTTSKRHSACCSSAASSRPPVRLRPAPETSRRRRRRRSRPRTNRPPRPRPGCYGWSSSTPRASRFRGASVRAGFRTVEDFEAKHDIEIETDDAGVARMELPKNIAALSLWVGKTPFVTVSASRVLADSSSPGRIRIPAKYAFRLETGVTAGGRVLDEKGEPVAGAKVEVVLLKVPKPARSASPVDYAERFVWDKDAVTTDAEGRWRVGSVLDHPEVELGLLVTHPGYVSDGHIRPSKDFDTTTAALRKETASLVLKRGGVVRGTVTGPDGKPVKDAIVIHGDSPYGTPVPCKVATDAEGRYRLPPLAVGPTSLTVLAPGWAPQFRTVEVKPGRPVQNFRMAAGKPVRLRFVDTAGKPIPEVSVTLLEWNGSRSIDSVHTPRHPKLPGTGIPLRADTNGVWEWPAAPAGPVKVAIGVKGYATSALEVTGGAPERMVTLKAEHRVTGTVTDAVTGKPVPGFTVFEVAVFGKDFLAAERGTAIGGKAGRLEFLATRTDIPLRLRVEAPGYRTQDGPEFRVGDDAGREQNFRLRPSRPLTGLVVGADGKSVPGAEVFVATPTEQVRIHPLEPVRSSFGWNHRALSDAAGRFEFPDPGEPWAVIARTDAGIALADFPADRADAGSLKLRPWGTVRGAFSDGGKPVREATVHVSPVRIEDRTRPHAYLGLQATTDADGRFEFPHVPPGPVSVQVYIGPWKDEGFRSGPSVPLDLKPGERVELNLGSGGATLTGKVKLTGKVPADLDCTYSLNYLVRREPGIATPEVASAGFDARRGWRYAWQKTAEGRAYVSTLRNWFVKLAPDGAFRVSGVPAGEYDLAVAVYAKPIGCLVEPLACRVVRVTVTAADAARGELKVPEVTAEVEPVPAVGDTPALSFTRADGKEGTLADSREKYTVVHFWASWCAPCKKQLPAIKKLHDRLAATV